MQSDSLVIIPTFNEIENIESIIRAVFSLQKQFDVLIVDDNSPDGTADVVSKLILEFSDNLFIENRKEKNGLGTAYIHGFKWALSKDYKYIFEMDADFSHNPKDLPRMYKMSNEENYDLVVGSRYVSGVNVVNWPMKRVLLSFFASKYVRFITSIPIHDTTAGFVCYKREVLEGIGLDSIEFVGYAFQIEMKFKAWKKGFKLKEIPVIFTDRTLGESKLSKTIFREAIFGVIKMKLKSFFA